MSTMDERQETFEVEVISEGERLDKWLTSMMVDMDYEVSRSQVQQWLAEGRVKGPKQVVKANDLVVRGASYQISVPAPELIELTPEDIPLDIVHEDDHVVVIDKPRGLVVHPAAGHVSGTVINGLAYRGIQLSPLGGAMRPGVVHRIDKDTSGLIVFAKTDQAYHRLSEQLREHSMDRTYKAIAHGVLPHSTAVIDAPIGRDPRNRQRMAVVEGGKPSVTHVRVVESFANFSYLELQLETGRTHQIRVHLAYIGHPIAGDPLYGRAKTLPISGQALHAETLGFNHPATGKRIVFHAALPHDMSTLLEDMRGTEELRL